MQLRRLQIWWQLMSRMMGKPTLSRQLGIRTGLLVSTLLALGVVLVYFIEGYRLEQRLNRQAEDLLSVYSGLIESEVLDADRETLRRSSHFLLNLEYVAGIEIKYPDGVRQSIGPADERKRSQDLMRERLLQRSNGELKIRIYFSRQGIRDQLLYVVLLGSLLVVLAFIIVFPTAHLLIFLFLREPLKYLLKGLREISSGNYQYRLARTMQIDVNEIIDNVNEMAEQIRIHEIELQISDTKYRHLVENSSDIIFSMNDDMQLITINHAVKKYLGFDVHELRGQPFSRLIYQMPDRTDDYRQLVFHQKLNEIRENGKSQSFKMELCTSQGEPREMNLRIEYVRVGSVMVFFGKAENLPENIMGQYCIAERRSFKISNYFNLADLVVNAITVNLITYFPEDQAMAIKIGVKEMVLNAIEHGNLGISYEEKTQATSAETFLNLVTRRQNDPMYSSRQVSITYSMNRHRVLYRIRDEGQGFDYEAVKASFEANIKRFHGRGIRITDSIFDIMRYNEDGTEVLLIKYTDIRFAGEGAAD